MIATIDHGTVRELRLARPPANALNPELIAALAAAVAAAPGAGAEALVLSGAPGIFSGGLDVPHLLTLDRAAIAATWRSFYRLMHLLAASPVPVIAALTGHSPAGGAVIAIFCDARIMAEGDFKIGLNEVRVGIPMPPVIYHAARRLVGARQAERLCVSGALISPAEAARVGLIDEVAPAESVVERAVGLASSLLSLPPAAMTATRKLARADLVALFDGGLDQELEDVLEVWFSAETRTTLQGLRDRLAARKD
jgi:3,2-trans-enoyl-CoA isomerase